jgi:hypothetical protein
MKTAFLHLPVTVFGDFNQQEHKMAILLWLIGIPLPLILLVLLLR